MRCYNFVIPIYNWDVTLFSGPYSEDEVNQIVQVLQSVKVPDDLIEEALSTLPEQRNAGHTFGCREWHRIIEVFSDITDIRSALSNLAHETRHMVNHICAVHGLEEEGGAYVAGEFWNKYADSWFLGDMFYQLNIDSKLPTTPTSSIVNPTLVPGQSDESKDIENPKS